MNYAQGNTRAKPDGFLHIQNFTVTKHAGLAGVVYINLFEDCQRETVETLLIDRAYYEVRAGRYSSIEQLVHIRHGATRFRKDFLKEHFQRVVHAYTKTVQMPVVEVFKHDLIVEREALRK